VGGFFDFFFSDLSAARDLTDEQRTLGGEPVVTLTIGSTSLDAYVWGYLYREEAGHEGGLTLWLDNRGDEFDDLSTDYPDITRGAAVDLRRGLPVVGVDTVAKLPRTWIEGLEYTFTDGAALLRLDCIDWRGKLGRYRYSSNQSWSATEVATIASSILGEVGLTLASGTFDFATDFKISTRREADDALDDLMRRVDEYLYAGEDGEIQHKELDPDEAAGYGYDWGTGGIGANHPLLRQSGSVRAVTGVSETTPRYNKVTVVGGPDGEYSGSSEDATESALVGERLRTLFDDDLGSDAQCEERARAELRFWKAQSTTGLIVARPHFGLRLYDMLSMAAPAWGGPAMSGRVMAYKEEYGRGKGVWEQRIVLGGGEPRGIGPGQLRDGVITGVHVDAKPVAARKYQVREGDDSKILMSLSAEEDAGTGTTATMEIRGKDGTSPEGYAELVAITTDGEVHSGVASVVISLDTTNGVIEFTGAVRMRMGQTYIEMTEQDADPDAPGASRCRLFTRDNGGKTELCARFPSGAIQQVAIEP
jgi:hypothetical protein